MSTPIEKQVHVSQLGTVFAALREGLAAAGVQPPPPPDLLARCLVAECAQCGIALTGHDLARLGGGGEPDEAAAGKVERLRQGYCARRDCPSYYYRLRFTPSPGIDWTAVVNAAGLPELGAGDAGGAPKPTATRSILRLLVPDDPKVLLRVAIGVGVLLALLLARHFMTGGSIPGLSPSPKYQVAPESLDPLLSR